MTAAGPLSGRRRPARAGTNGRTPSSPAVPAGAASNAARPIESEKSFLQAVRELARALGYLEYHTHNSRHSTAGFPDLILLRGTRLIVAELKTDKGRVTPDQEDWLQAFARLPDVRVFCWRPKDWDHIEAILR